uniref:Uncharacterized protein n=1 Tax=Fagus sylvatica TaxID=28930 RepID=A0A2N9IRE5_FAGSY
MKWSPWRPMALMVSVFGSILGGGGALFVGLLSLISGMALK